MTLQRQIRLNSPTLEAFFYFRDKSDKSGVHIIKRAILINHIKHKITDIIFNIGLVFLEKMSREFFRARGTKRVYLEQGTSELKFSKASR